jgi:Predicted acyl-CoA transferases/carnitine dehydratase
MGHGDVAADGKYGTIQQRDTDRAGVDGMVSDWTLQYSQKQVIELCESAQVPCGIVAAIDEIFEDPQYAARQNIVHLDEERTATLAVPNVVPRLSATPGSVDWLGPSLGHHNKEIYSELLKLTDEELQDLKDKNVI